jgi:hypothetical protein
LNKACSIDNISLCCFCTNTTCSILSLSNERRTVLRSYQS